VVPSLHRRLFNQEPLSLNPLVNPYNVLDATYKVVFAALTTAIIKHPFKNPGSIGILAFIAAIITIDDGLVFLFGKDTSNGSCHETFR